MRALLPLACACLLAPAGAAAQGYPTRPVSLVVPYAADSSADQVGRLLARRLAAEWKQPVEVVNRAGGGGAAGTREAAKAAADGYTLLFATNATMVTAPLFRENLGYDPLASFVPVTATTIAPYILVVSPQHPARNIGQLTALIRSAPGRVRYASLGRASNQFLAGELYQLLAQLEMREVVADVPRTTPLQLLQSGQADILVESFPGISGRIQDGSVRALAVLGHDRLPHVPDLPTAVEQGQGQLTIYQWSGLVAPAGTPAEAVLEINRAIQTVLRTQDVQAALLQQGLQAFTGPPEDMHALIKAGRAQWARVLRRK
jgi:tripartite-type tricarboxylate transporter receptor subunit TctC